MMDWLRRNPVIAALALLAAGLAVVLALEAGLGGPSAPAGPPRRAVPAEVKLLPQVAAISAEQAYPESANRPLFTPTRRPAPPVTVAAQPAFQRNQFVLLGVTIAGDTRIAMLRERSSGRLHRVEKGREVNGIKVAEIQPESVTLSLGAEQESLGLVVQKGPGATGQPAQPGQPPGMPPAVAPPTQGPFGAPSAAGAPPNVPQRSTPQPFAPGANAPVPAPVIPNPSGAPMPQTSQAPMTPEELLERRRARRAQQTQ